MWPAGWWAWCRRWGWGEWEEWEVEQKIDLEAGWPERRRSLNYQLGESAWLSLYRAPTRHDQRRW